MSRGKVTQLGAAIVYFFENYLPAQRGMSQHTIHSYRDAVVMLLRFTAQECQRGIEMLDLADLDAPRVERFLRHLQADRNNGIATRNLRLAAIHTLARFLSGQHPDRLGTWQAILVVPFKRVRSKLQQSIWKQTMSKYCWIRLIGQARLAAATMHCLHCCSIPVPGSRRCWTCDFAMFV